MSQADEVPTYDDVRSILLDANGALGDEDGQTALAKIEKAKRRCSILVREEGENGQ